MQNIWNSIKRFFSNKNTVTILAVLVGIAVLYFGYNWRVNAAITPVRVPYARTSISSRTIITEDMVGYINVSADMVNSNDNLVKDASQVIGKYVSYGMTVPENSLFYSEALMGKEEMPDSAFADIPDGYTIFSLNVDLHSTYGNSIFPGNYIDLYFKALDDSRQIIFGRMIESIEVLAVKDSQGQHVFESTTENRTPSELLFAVPDDMYLLLMKAGYITDSSVEIVPVPRNASYSADPGNTQVSSDYIREFILAKSAILPDESSSTNTDTNNQ